MSPKRRFQVMLDPEQLAALRAIEERTGAAIGEQIRRGVQLWLDSQRGMKKADRPRARTRGRS